MTDHHPTPRQALLDALVYAPAGLVLTVVEELPQLADKGRRRIEGRITTARVVGQFAVQFARQQVAQRRQGGGWAPGMPGSRPPAPAPASAAPASAAPASAAPAAAAPAPTPASPGDGDLAPVIEAPVGRNAPRPTGGRTSRPSTGRGTATRRATGAGGRGGATTGRTARAPRPGNPGTAGGSPGTAGVVAGAEAAGDGGSLGIPGYDSLSASQVVQRLAGLTPAELQAVRQHEAAGRHRRTILNRVDQLLGGATRGSAPGRQPGPDAEQPEAAEAPPRAPGA